MLLPEIREFLRGCCDDAREVYSPEKLIALGGVECVWSSVLRTCPRNNPTAVSILNVLLQNEYEVKRVIAGCLGMM